MKRDWNIFFNSVFFVLGFSIIFSLVGVLLQSVLSEVSNDVQIWLGRLGGVIIIFFGLYLLGLISPGFLKKSHKVTVKQKFSSSYVTSFVFGAAFAVGWTPCVGAVLGAVLALAVTQPTNAFFLMLSYSLGLGMPFLLAGFFVNQLQPTIVKFQKLFKYFNNFFGIILILLGILVFTNELSLIANLEFASDILLKLNMFAPEYGMSLSYGVAFFAGLVSFLSPCVLPLIPAFFAYLGSIGAKK